jgi:hypothetical protein
MKSLDRTIRGKSVLAGAVLTAAVTAFVAGFVGPGCSVEQPKTRCTTAKGAFTLKYTKVEGTGACGEIKGETAGVNSYWRPEGDRFSVTKGPVAIKINEVGSLLTEYGQSADSKSVVALGAFKTEDPDENGFCEVEMAQPANLKLAAVPPMPKPGDAGGMTDPLPAVDLTVKWSNVKFYVTAAQPGTMFTGRIEYAKTVEGQPPCSAIYDVVGLWPEVHCEGESPGQDGKPAPNGKPEPILCHPCADPAMGRALGSGISPMVDTVCDAETLTCVPKAAPPSLLATPYKCDAS